MALVAVAAVNGSNQFAVCDFGTSPPTVSNPQPAFAGALSTTAPSGTIVAASGTVVAAGARGGSKVQFFDITDPKHPAPGAVFATNFSGVGALAVSGALVAVGERRSNTNAAHVALIDFGQTPPAFRGGGPVKTSLIGFSSLAFTGDKRVAGAAPSGRPLTVEVDFATSPPTVVSFDPPASDLSPPGYGPPASFCLDADAAAGFIVLGQQQGLTVLLLDAVSKSVLDTATIGFVTQSVAISGTLVAAVGLGGQPYLIDFGVNNVIPTQFDAWQPGFGSPTALRAAMFGKNGVFANV